MWNPVTSEGQLDVGVAFVLRLALLGWTEYGGEGHPSELGRGPCL